MRETKLDVKKVEDLTTINNHEIVVEKPLNLLWGLPQEKQAVIRMIQPWRVSVQNWYEIHRPFALLQLS